MSSQVASRRRRLAIRLAAAALVWSVALLVTAVLAPVDGRTTSGVNGLTLSSATYVQRNGAWVLVPLAVPLLAGLAVAVAIARPDPRRRRVAVLVVAALAVLGVVLVLTGGVLLLVPAALLTVALRLTRTDGPDRTGRGGGRTPARSRPPRTRAEIGP